MSHHTTNHVSEQEYKPRGYHRLATLMSRDKSIAIFKRFDELNLLNLLSLQAEIFDMQRHFQFQCKQDDESKDDMRPQLSQYFYQLHTSRNSEQYRMLLDIRVKMKEYSKIVYSWYNEDKGRSDNPQMTCCCKASSQIAALSKPNLSQLSVLQEWLVDTKGGNCFQKGSEARLWEDSKSAFVAIKSSVGEQDTFTGWFTHLLIGVYHRIWGESRKLGTIVDEESGLMSYDESKINLCSQIFTTMISSVLPVLTILVLYIIHSTYWRIAASIVFTALFSALLAIFSTARRVEIFAATATFAAVEVVFIGSSLGNGD